MAWDNTKDVIATILHHPDLNIYADLYAKVFAKELIKNISAQNKSFEELIGYTLLHNLVYGKDLEQTILDLTGCTMETILIRCGILPYKEGCFNNLDFLSSIVYKNAEGELVKVNVIADPVTFEVEVSDINTLAEIKASVERDYIPKLEFGNNLLPIFNHKQKKAFGIPVFWYYDAQYAITRPIKGVSINGVEYCLDENEEIMLFPSMIKAKEYLASQGYSEATIRAEGIDIVEYSEKNDIPFGNATIAINPDEDKFRKLTDLELEAERTEYAKTHMQFYIGEECASGMEFKTKEDFFNALSESIDEAAERGQKWFTITIENEYDGAIERNFSERVINYVTSHQTRMRCSRCGKPVLTSDLEDYSYQCLHCDEDLCTIETVEAPEGAEISEKELYELCELVVQEELCEISSDKMLGEK